VRLALTAKVAVLAGGPGCGKSFTVRSVVELARARGARIVPAGRAARRLAGLAGHDAATIRRLLQLRPGGDPSFDVGKPLDADLVVVDETSMVDVILAGKLARAVPPGAHLLLAGDMDQLPPAGAGEVLRDLLAAGSLPAVRLTRIFRQARQSGIVVSAHRVNAGQQPRLAGFRGLLLVRRRGHRAGRRARRGHRGAADPGPVRPGPAPRRPGALPGAPRPGRSREPQPAAAAGPDPVP
jgi:exodeoxyribonuclease V alpha subunit